MKEKQGKKVSAILIAVIILLVIIIVAGMFVFVKMNRQNSEESAAAQNIGMEAGIISNDEDASAVEINEPFAFTTMYERDIYITNGHEATCYIGNSDQNYYEDMYIQIYLNDENDQPDEEIYLSQIIPRGSHIESFEAEKDLEPGTYRGTLVHSCLNEDGELAGDMAFVVELHVTE